MIDPELGQGSSQPAGPERPAGRPGRLEAGPALQEQQERPVEPVGVGDLAGEDRDLRSARVGMVERDVERVLGQHQPGHAVGGRARGRSLRWHDRHGVKPTGECAMAATSYFDQTGRSDVLGGGARMIPIETPAGRFKVWTKRVGNNPSIKLLLLHGGPGATHEGFEAFDSLLPAAGVEYYYYDQLGSDQ